MSADWRAARQRLNEVWRASGWYGDRSLGDEMSAAAQASPTASFTFVSGKRSTVLTFADLCRLGERAAGGLGKLGLERRDALVAQIPNRLEGAILFYACMRAGVIMVPVIHIYGPAELMHIANDSRAKCIVMPGRFRGIDWKERADRVSSVPSVEHVICLDDEPVGDVRWEDVIAFGGSVDEHRTDADERCLVTYTSGTTAAPKGAQHSHNSILSEVRSMYQMFGTSVEAPFLQAQPAGHMAGLLGLLRALIGGIRETFVLDTWDARTAAKMIREASIVATTGPPYFLTTLLDVAEAEGFGLESLRDYRTGGERVPVSLIERGDRAGVGAYRCYGSTEHPTVTSSLPIDPLSERATTDGRVLPGCAVRVVDDRGQDVPAGVDGELLTIGPDQFIGYTDDSLNDDAFRTDGWFRTGDVGRLDDRGVLTITDRIKDIIIRGGENISSRSVEEVLLRHPAVKDVAVIALPDRLYGERACAVVSLHERAHLDLAEVRRHFVEAGVARQKTPERLEIVGDLPRTAVGKIKKDLLRARFSAPEEWQPQEQL